MRSGPGSADSARRAASVGHQQTTPAPTSLQGLAASLSLPSCSSPPSASRSAGVCVSATAIPPTCPLCFLDLWPRRTQDAAAHSVPRTRDAHHPDQVALPFAGNQACNRGCQFSDEVQSSAPDHLSVWIQNGGAKLGPLGCSCTLFSGESTSQKKRRVLFKTAEQTDFRTKKKNPNRK